MSMSVYQTKLIFFHTFLWFELFGLLVPSAEKKGKGDINVINEKTTSTN